MPEPKRIRRSRLLIALVVVYANGSAWLVDDGRGGNPAISSITALPSGEVTTSFPGYPTLAENGVTHDESIGDPSERLVDVGYDGSRLWSVELPPVRPYFPFGSATNIPMLLIDDGIVVRTMTPTGGRAVTFWD